MVVCVGRVLLDGAAFSPLSVHTRVRPRTERFPLSSTGSYLIPPIAATRARKHQQNSRHIGALSIKSRADMQPSYSTQGVVQSLVDSFCQCFGTESPLVPREGGAATAGNCSSESPASSTSRRPLPPWNTLICGTTTSLSGSKASPVTPPKGGTRLSQSRKEGSRITAKRKRTASRDDIFRSKRDAPSSNSPIGPPPTSINPFLSRFLTSSPPVCMASLCFATPVRGDSSLVEDDDDEVVDNHHRNDAASVVSDSNTLNTAEDTITSTLYYETTKLAGFKPTNPPMALYNSHAVGTQDDIHQIVRSRSHQSSFKVIQPAMVTPSHIISSSAKQQYVPSIPPPQQVLRDNNMDDEEEEEEEEEPVTPQRSRAIAAVYPEESPPPVTTLSSDSSKSERNS